MQYVIRTDKPFQGHCETATDGEGVVLWSQGLTFKEYCDKNDGCFRLVSEAEFDEMLEAHYDTLKTEPVEITEERFDEMLEVLPPCRWGTVRGIEMFHVSERLTGNLVSWFARVGGRFFEFTDDASLSAETRVEKIGNVLKAA